MKCFFPVENSHFGRPKTNFCHFQKWKAKKKKKKVLNTFYKFYNFSYFHFQYFQFSPFHFTIFLLFFSIFHPFSFFFLASFFPILQQKFPGQKSLGGTLPPPVMPLDEMRLMKQGPPFNVLHHIFFTYKIKLVQQSLMCNTLWLEVNKCTLNFSREIRPIQCMCTEFWYVHWTSIKFRQVHWICLISQAKVNANLLT